MVVQLLSSRTTAKLLWGLDKRIDEEIAHCSGSLDNLPSTDQRVGRETEQDTGQHVKGVLLKIHDGLG